MVRPCKCRHVCGHPQTTYFKPRGLPVSQLEEVVLTIDEFEAIRLADMEGLYQEQAAKSMHISRQTFGNILESAHRKIADAIINAKALKIEGGTVRMIHRHFHCSDCNHQWGQPPGTDLPVQCPECQGRNIRTARQGRCCKYGIESGKKRKHVRRTRT